MTAIAPLRQTPFRRYLIGQTLSAFGDSLLPIALVFAVLGPGRHRRTARRRWLWPSIGYVAGLNLVAVCPFLVLGPVIADAVLGGPRAWTTIAVGYAVGGIGGSAVALRWRPRHLLRAAFAAALGLSPFLFLLGAAAPVPAITAAAVVAGAQAAVFNVFHGTTLQTHVPEHLVSRVASVNLLGALAAVPLGLALAGPLAAATSSQAVLTTGACCALIGTAAILLVPDVWRLPAVATAGPDPRNTV